MSSSTKNNDASIELNEKEIELEGIRIDIILAGDNIYQNITEYDNSNQNQNVITFK